MRPRSHAACNCPAARAGRRAVPGSFPICSTAAKAEGALTVYGSMNEQRGAAAVEAVRGRDRREGRPTCAPRTRRSWPRWRSRTAPASAPGISPSPPRWPHSRRLSGAVRSAGGQGPDGRRRAIPTAAGTAATPTTMRRLTTPISSRQADLPKTLRRVRRAQGMGRQDRHRRHRRRMARAIFTFYGEERGQDAGQEHRRGTSSRSSPTAISRLRARSAPANIGSRSTTTCR